MPLYEYVCLNGHRTEVMHGIHATGPSTCPVCGAAMRKAFVAPAIVFKGSGWAKVDRRSSGGRKAAGETSTADAAAVADPTATPKTEPAPASSSATEKPASKSTSSATD